MTKGSTVVIALLLIVIALLAWLLIAKSAEAPSAPITATTTTPTPSPTPGVNPAPAPLHDRVTVTFPKAGASVPKKFTVTGKAPGNWFFEASAPVMVQTDDGSKVAQTHIQAKGDWMTTELVEFEGEVTINPAYSGPATLVFLKDNPSGLPENDDSLEIPIIVQ